MEYAEVLENHITHEISESIIQVILNNKHTKKIDNYLRVAHIDADPDDNKFVDCAFASKAKFLVSDDNHLKAIKGNRFINVEVVRLPKYSAHVRELFG